MSRVDRAALARDAFANGWRLNKSEAYGAAVRSFRAGLENAPSNFDGWMGLGHALSELGRDGAASRAFERAALLRPTDDGASSAYFHALLRAGLFMRACRESQRFLKLVDLGEARGERVLVTTYQGFRGWWRPFLEELRAERRDPVAFAAGQEAMRALFEKPLRPQVVVRLLRRAVSLKDARAQAWLGRWLLRGARQDGELLVRKDPAAGIRLVKAAAAHDLIEAVILLAECYATGVGTKRQPTEARRLLRRASRWGWDEGVAKQTAKIYRALGDRRMERQWMARSQQSP
jgi:TPR repeat protein